MWFTFRIVYIDVHNSLSTVKLHLAIHLKHKKNTNSRGVLHSGMESMKVLDLTADDDDQGVKTHFSNFDITDDSDTFAVMFVAVDRGMLRMSLVERFHSEFYAYMRALIATTKECVQRRDVICGEGQVSSTIAMHMKLCERALTMCNNIPESSLEDCISSLSYLTLDIIRYDPLNYRTYCVLKEKTTAHVTSTLNIIKLDLEWLRTKRKAYASRDQINTTQKHILGPKRKEFSFWKTWSVAKPLPSIISEKNG